MCSGLFEEPERHCGNKQQTTDAVSLSISLPGSIERSFVGQGTHLFSMTKLVPCLTEKL